MLMPILTVKMPSAEVKTAVAVETATLRERKAENAVRISGNQSAAVLKILERLNRHLIGSEPLPKEALVRLLETLSKILKFPPLPQESLRDFSKRLAVFFETLPPPARAALEKQLGQRNLTVAIRILAEILKNPSFIDAPRLLEKLLVARLAFEPATITQPEQKPTQSEPARQGQGSASSKAGQGAGPVSSPPRQAAGTQILPASPMSQASVSDPMARPLPQPVVVQDAIPLQAALKKAFGDSNEPAAAKSVLQETGTEQESVSTSRSSDQTGKPADTGPGSTAAPVRSVPPFNMNTTDPIPQLRAAVAFLATDPEALSQVSAIAFDDVDPQVEVDLALELAVSDAPYQTKPAAQQDARVPAGHASSNQGELKSEITTNDNRPGPLPSEEANVQVTLERPSLAPNDGLQTALANTTLLSKEIQDFGVEPRQAENSEEEPETPLKPPVTSGKQFAPQSVAEQKAPAVALPLANDAPATEARVPAETFAEEQHFKSETPPISGGAALFEKIYDDIPGFTVHDLGEWALDIEPQPLVIADDETPFSMSADIMPEQQPEKELAEALKALVEANLLLPEGAESPAYARLEMPISAIADKGTEQAVILQDTEFLSADATVQQDLPDFENVSWSALLPEQEEAPADKQVSVYFSTTEDNTPAPATPHRQTEVPFGSNPIPFAMIPYLPANMLATKSKRIEDEEAPGFTGDERQEQQGSEEDNGNARQDEGENSVPESTVAEDDVVNTADAYDLYRRMGGLG